MELLKLKNGATVLAVKPYSYHPADSHLYIVLATWDRELVTWIANTSHDDFARDGATCEHGVYFSLEERDDAYLSFYCRGTTGHVVQKLAEDFLVKSNLRRND